MAMADHLRELRRRLFICLLAVGIALIPAFFSYSLLVDWLNEPYCTAVQNLDPEATCKFLETNPVDLLTLRMRIAGWGALILAMPVILWQIWRFVAPGLYKKERRYALAFVVAAMALFVLGAAIAYFTLTKATEFLVGLAGSEVEVRAGIGNFTRLAMLMMVSFGIGFQFPVLMVALQMVGVLTPSQLAGWRRPVALAIVVIAAGITPSGDPFSLLALAVPMYLLFEISILLGRLVLRRRRKAASASEAERDAARPDEPRSDKPKSEEPKSEER
jgi:sec-independent protein translocase protein TatC